MEHLNHFDLKQDPFQNEPDLRFYFDSLSHVEPARRVERALRQNKGLCVLTGEGGTGKSLLARRLLENLEEEIFDAQFLLMMPGATDATSVLSRYARMVGVEDSSQDRPGLLGQIFEQLAMVREEGRHSVLMIDDAHLLSNEALAEIGGLLNLEYEDRRLVSLFLIGLPKLDVTLCHEASLGQRVDVRVLIGPLDFQNSSDYLMHRLSLAGGSPDTIPADAMGALYKFGRGRPRLLNTLADNALFEAYLAGRKQLTAEDVERAAADLGVGSHPGQTYTAISPVSSGSLAGPQPLPSNDAPAMELDQMVDSSFKASSFVANGASASAFDLSELATPGGGSLSELSMGDLSLGGTDDLDSAVQEMLGDDASSDELPVLDSADPVLESVEPEFESEEPVIEAQESDLSSEVEMKVEMEIDDDSELCEVEAIPIAEADELTADPLVEGEAEDDDELDDLFVELIDE